jgi:hypothetical protein
MYKATQEAQPGAGKEAGGEQTAPNTENVTDAEFEEVK